MSMYMIDGIILFLVGIAFLTITVIKPFDKPKNSYITILSCAFIVCSFILFAEDFLQKDEEVENKAHSVIEENYEDCTFADDNTFYWHDKVYEYKLDENKNQVNIVYLEDGTKKVATYELKKSK